MPLMQRFFLIITACLALFVAGCGADSNSTEEVRERASALAEKYEKEEKAEARKAAKEEAEAEKARKEELAKLPKLNIPSGPPPKKLVAEDVKEGSGASAKAGDEVSVHYVGVLYKDGEVFDANWGEDEPFSFSLGAGEVIKGWDQGVQGMKVGGKRELIIPPALAYGNEGVYPSIPPKSTLVFLVELLKAQ
jgi:peptidylprolyl isomerase